MSDTPPVDLPPNPRIKEEKDRLRALIFKLIRQVRDRSVLDQFLTCLSPATAIDGRLPFTPRHAITTENRVMLLHNTLAHAILKWGMLARGEGDPVNTELQQLETVAATGFQQYGAFPKERNSAIMVLRTVAEERAVREKRAKAAETAQAMRERRMLSREEPDEEPAKSPSDDADGQGEETPVQAEE